MRWREQPHSVAGDDIATLLRAWSAGDQSALNRLTPLVYEELRRLAQFLMNRERPGHSLEPTALVNEMYLRLMDYRHMNWQNCAHFFAVSSQLMRRILIEDARRRNGKRGGGVRHVSLDEAAVFVRTQADEAADALGDAVSALGRFDRRKMRVVQLRFFIGLSVEETARTLQVSPVTVRRDWHIAKLWLFHEVTSHAGSRSASVRNVPQGKGGCANLSPGVRS